MRDDKRAIRINEASAPRFEALAGGERRDRKDRWATGAALHL
jgi:hypothetical protein